MYGGGDDRTAGVLGVVQGGVGGPLQGSQVARADRGRGRGTDRRGDVDGAPVVQDDRGVQHADQLRKALLQAGGGQLEDGGELIASEAADGRVRARPGGEPGAVAARTASPVGWPIVSFTALE